MSPPRPEAASRALRTLAWTAAALTLLTAQLGQAQEPAPAPAVVPPSLVDFVEAAYPPEAEAAGLEGQVELLITIAADGSVTEVEVKTPAGNGFDEAAAAAARRFRFTPALVNGAPTPARIGYRYVFELPEAPLPEEPEPGAELEPEPGRLTGRVLASEDDAPLGFVDVTLESDALAEPRTSLTAEDGSFRFDGLPPGAYTVKVADPGLGTLEAVEDVGAGEETAVIYRLDSGADVEDADVGYVARAVVDPPPREVTRRTIPREALTRIPGTRGDALRAVELMPGVGRPPFGAGTLIVRGSAPGDSEVLLEGIPVPLLYHFGGLTSFFNSRLLERIDFYPGNFSARYGRVSGGILDVGVRDPATDRFHGVAEFGVIDASLLAEGPITDKLSVGASIRRSIVDLIFSSLLSGADLQVTNAPVYYDYQLIATYRPTTRDRLRLLIYGTSDAFKVIFDEAQGDDPSVRGGAALFTRFHSHQLSWRHDYSRRTYHELSVNVGPTKLGFSLGDELAFDLNSIDTTLRGEWHIALRPNIELIVGTDTRVAPYDVVYRGPQPTQMEGGGASSPDRNDDISIAVDGVVVRPALFAELALDLDALRLVLGGRADYFSEINELTFDPRLVALYKVNQQLSLKAGVGLFSQPPEFQESNAEIGNDELDPIRSAHVTVGGDYRFTDSISLGVEGFYKYLWDRPVSTVGGAPPSFTSIGIGRIYGLEVAGRIQPSRANYFGYLSYTLSRSERRDRPDQTWRLFDYDQTHIFTAAYVHRLPRNWEVGGTLRLVSGNPFTTIPGGTNDLSTGRYQALPAIVNGERSPMFNRLDVRVEKQWHFDAWKLAFFLDLQNAYNMRNQEGLIYNFDYTESTPINGLPIIPALGLRGEM